MVGHSGRKIDDRLVFEGKLPGLNHGPETISLIKGPLQALRQGGSGTVDSALPDTGLEGEPEGPHG